MKILEASNYEGMSRKAANIISAQVILFPRSVLGLATGSTPLGIYRQLIDWYQKGDIDFSHVTSVNLDEYCGLGPDDSQSYRYYMNTNFFRHINIRTENTFVPDGLAEDFEEECRRYDERVSALGGIDLQLLGIGETGHIGFNEPDDTFDKMTHQVALKQKTIEANSRFFKSPDEVPQYALTMGIKAIMQAKKILLVANGPKKADVLEKALFGPVTPEVPASILQLHPDVTVVADSEALRVIHEKHPSGK
ncbi:glucosamine-6-phosphate deaminase [Caproicibacterium lactatifermentans]|jgi:glucosamine-6-phosphate deaminase|uniref:Glucosamine-6-phosphate deaminase n=1 Tax=Caproicibacterium lactatifermentans TaxID=2666138 RepID=A0ABX6PUE4_9FIRM|nr:glucosamine-6-phosphate deaminase [Caproicibacterium lactatifermentans]ARP50823.1 glucosamine-6-phosphate deaminase [Ruminococcaceae bacterium CPB6]MDD4807735.1 glucosamine-6-phosphate deaminase [Oscillospiraceae bacterium]QKO29873.1 glucosamine-6-phosphate deaminase [Caproicibacterium lactatifermentans]